MDGSPRSTVAFVPAHETMEVRKRMEYNDSVRDYAYLFKHSYDVIVFARGGTPVGTKF